MRALHLLIALVTFIVGIYAPFPGDDPRAIFNPFIVPWWYQIHPVYRDRAHLRWTGSHLPPEDFLVGPHVRGPGHFLYR